MVERRTMMRILPAHHGREKDHERIVLPDDGGSRGIPRGWWVVPVHTTQVGRVYIQPYTRVV